MFLYCFVCVKYSIKINCTQICWFVWCRKKLIYFIDVLIFLFVYLGLGFITNVLFSSP